MNAWLPQASYPCGNFSDTPSLKLIKTKGSIGHAVNLVRSSISKMCLYFQTPPTQVWKSVRRLFHDCQTTIMRSTKSHVLEGNV